MWLTALEEIYSNDDEQSELVKETEMTNCSGGYDGNNWSGSDWLAEEISVFLERPEKCSKNILSFWLCERDYRVAEIVGVNLETLKAKRVSGNPEVKWERGDAT